MTNEKKKEEHLSLKARLERNKGYPVMLTAFGETATNEELLELIGKLEIAKEALEEIAENIHESPLWFKAKCVTTLSQL